MNIKLRNRHVYQGVQLVARFADREMPEKISYACGKSLVALQEHFQFVESRRLKLVKKHQKRNPDGTLKMKPGKNDLGQEVDVPDLESDDAFAEELDVLREEEVEIDVHCITRAVWNEHMQRTECKECKRGKIDVSSNEMAALIRLGILVDGDDNAS